MVDDVIVDNGDTLYLYIAKNARIRIKNDQSRRNVPLHTEVLRLIADGSPCFKSFQNSG
jgi:hypothetical protein